MRRIICCVAIAGLLLGIAASAAEPKPKESKTKKVVKLAVGLLKLWGAFRDPGFKLDLDIEDLTERPIGVTRDGKPIVVYFESPEDERKHLPRVLFLTDESQDAAAQPPVPENLFDSKQPFLWSVAGLTKADDAGFPPSGTAYDRAPADEKHYLWRWIGMYAPDLIVQVQPGKGETWYVPTGDFAELNDLRKHLPDAKPLDDDSFVAKVAVGAPCNVGRIPAVRIVTDTPEWGDRLADLIKKSKLSASPARLELEQRAARSPKQIVDQLLPHYGKKLDQVAYIPALAVLGRVRQEKIDGGADAPLSELVQNIMKPYLDGTKKSLDGKAGGSGLSGHLLFGELAELTGDKRYSDLVLAAANHAFDKAGQPLDAMPTHSEMSDAVFMGCAILAQAGKLTGDAKYAEMCLTHLKFMEKLCLRKDGLYRHSPLDEAAWGRGNGFPALGLCWSLDELPESFAGREYILKAYRAHLETLLKFQDPSGMWHQVIDKPESYREFTATAMICYAMMRGVQEGRLDRAKFAEPIEKAWSALKLRIATDGTLVDVCTGTGKQKSLRDYYDRPAILGRDDRGGAMALMVSTERELYEARLAK